VPELRTFIAEATSVNRPAAFLEPVKSEKAGGGRRTLGTF
jgi:hypothetical protein